MTKNKILVAFYSRTGNTKRTAIELAKILRSDLDEIIDIKDRKGVKGWLFAGRDATRKEITGIAFKKNPSKYELVIIGTPIWAFTVTPAVRTYLMQSKFKRVAFFSTSSGSGIMRTFKEMQSISQKPVAALALKSKAWSTKLDIAKTENKEKIRRFCEHIKRNI